MPIERTRYIPFLNLPEEWALESGLPRELTLRHVCEWTIAGAFPSEALVTRTGAVIAPNDVYLSWLAISQTRRAFDTSIHLGGWTIGNSNGRLGLGLLSEILVTAPNIIAFCDHTNTLPPPCLLNGAPRVWRKWRAASHLAPPPHPEAEQIALRHQRREHAISTMNWMRSLLDGWQGKPTRFGPYRNPGEPVDLPVLNTEWGEQRKIAGAEIQEVRDASLSEMLAHLDRDWAAFVQREQRTDVLSDTADLPPADEGSESGGEQVRRRGRPLGSGSLESQDAPLLEEMHNAIVLDPTLSVAAAADVVVDRAKGGGTPASKQRRLIERYSAKFRRGT